MGEMQVENPVNIHFQGGANLIKTRPLFSFDGSYLILCAGPNIKVTSVASGEIVHILRGHKSRVTGLLENPNNKFQIYSCGLDGQIIRWAYQEGLVLDEYTLGLPIFAIYGLNDGFVIAQVNNRGSDEVVVKHVTLQSGKSDVKQVILSNVPAHEKCISTGCQGNVVASIKSKVLQVYLTKTKETKSWELTDKHLQVDRSRGIKLKAEMTCVACHPTEMCIATGVSTGAIVLWYNISGKKHPSRLIKKWHVLPVLDLCFTPGGSYFYSGGGECVLVKWTYNDEVFETLPRLGAPIGAISVSSDATVYSTSHTDNAVQIWSARGLLKQHIQGLTAAHLDQQVSGLNHVGLNLDPRTGALVSNGRLGHLQFYSIEDDKQMYNLDIVQQNYVSGIREGQHLLHTDIENCAFSQNGDWLATIERRDDGKTTPEMKLKFWRFNEKSQQLELNTVVDTPHPEAAIGLKFRPIKKGVTNRPMAVSTSRDGKFKIWTLNDDTDIYRENVCWQCESQGYYRDLPCGPCDFSQDGSLLAVGFGQIVTLWDPETNSFRHSLTLDSNVTFLNFGQGSCSHYLMCTTVTRIYALNLLTCAVEWSRPCHVVHMAVCPGTPYMAFIKSDNQFGVLTPANDKLVYKYPGPISNDPIISTLFVPIQNEAGDLYKKRPNWLKRHVFYFMNSKQELCSIDVEREKDESSAKSLMNKLTQQLPETPFSVLMNSIKKTGAKDVSLDLIGQKIGQPGSTFLQDMLHTPAHVLPPVTSMCMAFHQTLLLPNKHRKTKKMGGATSDDDDSSDSDDDVVDSRMIDSDSDQSEMEIEDETDMASQKQERIDSDSRTGVNKDQFSERGNVRSKDIGKLKIGVLSLREQLGYDEITESTFEWLTG